MLTLVKPTELTIASQSSQASLDVLLSDISGDQFKSVHGGQMLRFFHFITVFDKIPVDPESFCRILRKDVVHLS
jgi:hypothetical protein